MNEQRPEGPPPDFRAAEPRRARRHRVLAWVLSALGILLVAAVVAGFVVHLPYVIISPGSATPLDSSVITVHGAPTYPRSGGVSFLTVRVSPHDPSLWRLVTAWLDPDQDVEKRTDVVGCLSDSDNQSFNVDLMDQSQNDAKYVALTHLGYTVKAEAPRVTVIEVCKGTPAYGALHVGDRVVAVDGHPVAKLTDVAPLVQAHHPGDRVDVRVERDGRTVDADVVAGSVAANGATCRPARSAQRGDGRDGGDEAHGPACLGITSQAFVHYQFPVDVKIDTSVIGPSAGLAFTLAIIDDLTPGSLTGGKVVAVTGEIQPDGTVDPVGGVEQKAITARTSRVALMIVPRSEVADAKRGAGSVPVVGVDNVDQALAALRAAGGTAVPPPSTTAARS